MVDTKKAQEWLDAVGVEDAYTLAYSLADEVERQREQLVAADSRLVEWEKDQDALDKALYNRGAAENSLGLLQEKHKALLAAAKGERDMSGVGPNLLDAIAACEEGE